MRDSSMCGLGRSQGDTESNKIKVIELLDPYDMGVVSDASRVVGCGTCIEVNGWSVIQKDGNGHTSVLLHAFIDEAHAGASWSNEIPRSAAYKAFGMGSRDRLLSALFVSVSTATVMGALDPDVTAAICASAHLDIDKCRKNALEMYKRVRSIQGIASLMSRNPLDAIGVVERETLPYLSMCDNNLWDNVGMLLRSNEDGQSSGNVCISMKRRRPSGEHSDEIPDLEPLVWLVDRTMFPTHIFRQYAYRIDNKDEENFKLMISHTNYLVQKQPIVTNVSSGVQSVYPCPVPLFNAMLVQSSLCSCSGCECQRCMRKSPEAIPSSAMGAHQMRQDAYNELGRQISSLCEANKTMRLALVVDALIGLYERHEENGDLNSIMSFLVEFNVSEADGGFKGRFNNLFEPILFARRELFNRLQSERMMDLQDIVQNNDDAVFKLNSPECQIPCISTCLKTEHILLALTTQERATLFGALLEALQSYNVQHMINVVERYKELICVWLRYNPKSLLKNIHFPAVYVALVQAFDCKAGKSSVKVFYQANFSFNCTRDRIEATENGGFRVTWRRTVRCRDATFIMDVPGANGAARHITITCDHNIGDVYVVLPNEECGMWLLNKPSKEVETQIAQRVLLKKTSSEIKIDVNMIERYDVPDLKIDISIVHYKGETHKILDITL